MKTTFEHLKLNRSILKHILVVLVISVTAQLSDAQPNQTAVEQWDIFELSLNGPQDGNPFLDVALSGQFIRGDRIIEVNGFYDGNGKYIIRFMPNAVGKWNYVTKSSKKSLDLQLMCIGQFPIAPTAPPVHHRPRLRALALLGRRPH